MKNYEQYKRMVKFTFSIILLSMEMMCYWYVWLNFYNTKMEIPYNRTGHWLMVAVYGILLILFNAMYGGLKIGYLKTGNMIYSQTLASICANAMIYLQITLLTKHFQDILPLASLTAAEILIITLWSFLFNRIYRKIYPPRNVLLIYGEHPVASLMGKLHTRTDRFVVGEVAHISLGLNALQNKICDYEGVLICDVPSTIRNQLLKFCYKNSIRVYATPKISDIIIRSAESFHMFDTPLMLCRNSGLTFEQRFLKRGMDIIFSFSALVILAPVFLLTAIAVKMYDHGSIFYFQNRCTKDGEIFSICKFRSMVENAEQNGKSMPATEGDSRITPVGRIIRKVRIDELPQLFNILKGEMSIVGPRPERIEHVEMYSKEIPEFEYRMKIKGGLTGYAQVYGKYNTTAYDKLKLDLMYIQNYSIWLDIEIIFKTVKILFMKESTEGFSESAATSINQYRS